MKYGKIRIVNKYKPICHTKHGLLLYRNEKLFLMDTCLGTVSFLMPLPIEDKRRWLCFCSLGTRLMHVSVYCGVEIEEGALIAFNKGIYKINIVEKTAVKEHEFRNGMRRPLMFTRINGLQGFKDSIVYGEYFSNEKRENVRIYARGTEAVWTEKYTFAAGQIRHIHSITVDKFRDRVIVATGDNDEEAAIWTFEKDFQIVKKLLSGRQQYRSCCVQPYKNGLLLVTDSPYDENSIYWLSDSTNEVKQVRELPGPVVFYTTYNNELIFATNVENDGRNKGKIRQMFSNKRGFGVKDWYVHVFGGNLEDGFKEIYKIKKDSLPMVPFGFGNVHFPAGQVNDKIFFYPTAVKHSNEHLCCIELEK